MDHVLPPATASEPDDHAAVLDLPQARHSFSGAPTTRGPPARLHHHRRSRRKSQLTSQMRSRWKCRAEMRCRLIRAVNMTWLGHYSALAKKFFDSHCLGGVL